MQWKFGRICFFKGWKEFTKNIKMAVGETLEFKFRHYGLELQMYRGAPLWTWECTTLGTPVSIKFYLHSVQLMMFIGWRDDRHHACSTSNIDTFQPKNIQKKNV
jgi:hypothetical protein